MPEVGRRLRIVNTGKRRNKGKRKRLTPKQIKFFGTARQRAALKSSRKRKRKNGLRASSIRQPKGVRSARNKGIRKVRRATARRRSAPRRRRNVSEIITLSPVLNPFDSEVRGMTRNKRRRKSSRRRRTTVGTVRRRRRSNRGRRRNPTTRIVYRNRGRRRSNRGRRRNPGFLTGKVGQITGIFSGAVGTSVLTSLLPAGLSSGMAGYVSMGAIAMLLGTLARTAFKSDRAFGDNVTVGGFVVLGLKIMNDFVPQLAAGLPFGLRGMGVIAPSSYALPLINRPNSMTQFIRPSYIPAQSVVPAMAGMRGFRGYRAA